MKKIIIWAFCVFSNTVKASEEEEEVTCETEESSCKEVEASFLLCRTYKTEVFTEETKNAVFHEQSVRKREYFVNID